MKVDELRQQRRRWRWGIEAREKRKTLNFVKRRSRLSEWLAIERRTSKRNYFPFTSSRVDRLFFAPVSTISKSQDGPTKKKKENGERRRRTEKHPHFFHFHFVHKKNETKTKIISFEISGYRLVIEWLNYVWLSVINVRPGPESIKWLFDSFYANKLWRTSVVRLIRWRRTKP